MDSTDDPDGRGTLQVEEARRSFDRQIAQLEDVDDKAMRSVRTAVVVIGFVVTAAGIVARNGSVRIGFGPLLFTGISVFFLAMTVVAGVGTYTVTEYRNRLTDRERARLDDPGTSARTERAELLRIYQSWRDLTEEELDENAKYLTVTLFSLTLGMLSLFIAGTLAAARTAYRRAFEPLPWWGTAILAVVVAVVVLLAVGGGTRLLVEAVNRQS